MGEFFLSAVSEAVFVGDAVDIAAVEVAPGARVHLQGLEFLRRQFQAAAHRLGDGAADLGERRGVLHQAGGVQPAQQVGPEGPHRLAREDEAAFRQLGRLVAGWIEGQGVGADADALFGDSGEDRLIGGAGDDLLNGSDDSGWDTYVLNRGDGADVIQENGGFARLEFGEGIAPEDLRFSLSPENLGHLVITYANAPLLGLAA